MQITKACLIKTRTIHFRVKSRNRNTDLESVFFPLPALKSLYFSFPQKRRSVLSNITKELCKTIRRIATFISAFFIKRFGSLR